MYVFSTECKVRSIHKLQITLQNHDKSIDSHNIQGLVLYQDLKTEGHKSQAFA